MSQYVLSDTHPYLREFTTNHILKPGYDFAVEFEFGLDAILDALTRSTTHTTG
jgi:hypothetical protein